MSTIQTNTTLALTGSAGFTLGADTLSWSNRWLDTVNFTSGTSKLALTAAANLSGGNWAMRNLVFSGTNGLAAQITDQDAATGRYIENVVLGSSSVVRLQSTGIGTMTGSAGVDDIITGSAYVAKIDLGAGNNLLTVGSGGAGTVLSGSGNDRITTGSGWIGSIAAGSGNNVVATGSAYVTAISALDGNDSISIGAGGGKSVDAGNGVNTITADGFVSTIVTGTGADTITLGRGGADSISAGSGNNLIATGSGYLGSLTALGGNDTVTIGSGGAGLVDAGGGTNRITADIGWVKTIQTLGGSDVITVGAGGAGDILAGDGANTITTGSGWVNSIQTGGASDTVVLGSGGVGLVSTGNGADTIVLNELNAKGFVKIDGGSDAATDTLDVSHYSHGVTLTLDQPNTWQSVGSGGVILANLEKIVGSAYDDVLTGASSGSNINNVLVGGAGNDTLDGGAGADRLVGGSGTDRLIGGSGADVFQFDFASDTAVGAARDVIVDFSQAEKDVVDLTRIDANTSVAGDQAFQFFVDGVYHANGLWLKDGILYGDVDGKAGADFEISMNGIKALVAGDFLL